MKAMWKPVLIAPAVLWLAVGPGVESHAGGLFHRPTGTPPPGRARHFEHSDARAGDPRRLLSHAVPTNGPGYAGYFVGGGAACGGCVPRPDEGTWGWDYRGVWIPRRIGLSWSHGRLYQGGTGMYRTDGFRPPGRQETP